MANVLDDDIVISEFELHSRYYAHFQEKFTLGKLWTTLSSKLSVREATLLFFNKGGFAIEKPIDMPLNKETKQKGNTFLQDIFLINYSISNDCLKF